MHRLLPGNVSVSTSPALSQSTSSGSESRRPFSMTRKVRSPICTYADSSIVIRSPLIEGVGEGKRERGNGRVEARAVGSMHLIRASHLTARRPKDAPARVFEVFPGLKGRLVPHDAGPLHLLNLAVAVRDDPVAASQLRRAVAVVRDVNRVREDVAMGAWSRLLRHVHGFDVDLDAIGERAGHDAAIATRASLVQEKMSRPSVLEPLAGWRNEGPGVLLRRRGSLVRLVNWLGCRTALHEVRTHVSWCASGSSGARR